MENKDNKNENFVVGSLSRIIAQNEAIMNMLAQIISNGDNDLTIKTMKAFEQKIEIRTQEISSYYDLME